MVYYAAWLRRRWDAEHPPDRQLRSMCIYRVTETTQPDYAPPRLERVLVYEWRLGGPETVHQRGG